MSPIVKVIAEVGVLSFVDCGPIAVIVGGVLALTVKTKFVEAVSVPSLTVIVIVEVPFELAVGVRTTVRLDPFPPKEIFAFGISAVFEEVPESVNPLG